MEMENIVKRIQNFDDAIGRFWRGMFWYPVGKLPEHDECLIIPGDPEALPRSNPFWRDQWKWIVLKVPHPAPFLVFFECEVEGVCMRFFRKICTPFVVMRVGPETIKVVAMSLGGHGADPMKLDVFIPTATEGEIRNELALKHLTYKVTWV